MKIIAVSYKTKGGVLDDDYTLFENGDVLHQFDRHPYPGGFNLKETLKAEQLGDDVKIRLLDAASKENKELARFILGLD